MFWAVAVDFGEGDYLQPSTLLDCGCFGSFTLGTVSGLNGSTKRRTSCFILFASGSNHSFVDGPLTHVAPPRASWRSARGDSMVSPDRAAQGGVCGTLLNREGLVVTHFQICRGRDQSVRQSRYMLQATGNTQVVESQLTVVRRPDLHTSEHVMMMNVISAFTPAALGTRVIRRLVGEIGNALEMPKY